MRGFERACSSWAGGKGTAMEELDDQADGPWVDGPWADGPWEELSLADQVQADGPRADGPQADGPWAMQFQKEEY